jgi:hypothetical protein
MGYSTIDIENRLGINRERLRVWTSSGYIEPSVPSPGQGLRAEFSREDVLKVCLFDELLRIGLKRAEAGGMVSKCKPKHFGNDYVMFFVLGDDISIIPFGNIINVIEGVSDGRFEFSHLHVVNLKKIRGTVDSAFPE